MQDNLKLDKKIVVNGRDSIATNNDFLLDSSLISPTFSDEYNIKIIECGDFKQVYFYQKKKMKKNEKKDFDLKLLPITALNKIRKNKSNKIESKNITRSRVICDRIAKANINEWKTFITLTFNTNVTEIEIANKRFRYFIDKIRKVKEDFKYLGVPEFHKNGKVHYHLITNINIKDKTLIYNQSDSPRHKHIKYWNEGYMSEGFDSVKPIKGDKSIVIRYISKYMTKDIDDRLFTKHRFLHSNNLIMPKEYYIDSNNDDELQIYYNIINGLNLKYQNEYKNPYNLENIYFFEYA